MKIDQSINYIFIVDHSLCCMKLDDNFLFLSKYRTKITCL